MDNFVIENGWQDLITCAKSNVNFNTWFDSNNKV